MPAHLTVPVLADTHVRLEPLAPAHLAGLREAVSGTAIDASVPATVPTSDTIDAHVEESLAFAAAGERWPFVLLDAATGQALGCTSYLTPRWWPGEERLLAVEIGGTWLRAAAQGTAVNSAAKRLLLGHAFDVLGVSRVDIKTDARNARARAAIVGIGARFEGVLRNWQPSAAPGEAGLPRDTAMHAITAAEWPGVRSRLEARIQAKLDRPV